MNVKKLDLFVETLVTLPTRQWATVRNHERNILKDYSLAATYTSNSENNPNVKYPQLVNYGMKLAWLQKENFDVYCNFVQMVQSERDKRHVKNQNHPKEWYTSRQAEYQRRYRAKKAGKKPVDNVAQEFIDKRLRTNKLVEAGLPRPKSLTHAQQMKAQLEAYIAEEERQHGTGNVSATQD